MVPPLFPEVKIFYFIPFLVRCFYLKTLNGALIAALITGITFDLLSAHSRFGLYSVNFVITTYFLYGIKKNFFEDHLSTLPFATFFFSFFSCLLQYLLLIILDGQSPPLTFHFVFVDFLIMPLMDSAFAFCVFTTPKYFFGKPARQGNDYFLHGES